MNTERELLKQCALAQNPELGSRMKVAEWHALRERMVSEWIERVKIYLLARIDEDDRKELEAARLIMRAKKDIKRD